MKELIKKDYITEGPDANMTFTVSKADKTYIISIPELYPFKPPSINGINGKSLIDNYEPRVTIYQLIEKYNDILKLEEPKPKILIYCHPRPADDHWQKEIMTQIVAKYDDDKYDEATKITIDTLPGGTITADGFSDSFINNNPFFDYVFLPDCGGVWFEYQRDNKQAELSELILKLTTLLKPGGVLVLGKFYFWSKIPFERTQEGIEKVARDEMFKLIKKKLTEGLTITTYDSDLKPDGKHEYIIIQKTA